MARLLGRFGPRVIGEKKAEEEREAAKTKRNKYGPRMLNAGDGNTRGPKLGGPDPEKVKSTADKTPPTDPAGPETTADTGGAPTDGPFPDGFPEGLDAVEFTKLHHGRAIAVIEHLDDTEKLVEFRKAEHARERGPRSTVIEAFEGKGIRFPEVTTDEIQVRTAENPAAVDELLDAEERREGGPRVTALRHLLSAENKREGGAREEIQDRIEKLIDQVSS